MTTTAAHWLHDANGTFATNGDWSTGKTPTSNDDVILDAAGATDYAVTVSDATVASIQTAATARLTVAAGGDFVADNGTGTGVNAGSIFVGPGSHHGQTTFSFGGTIDNTGFMRLYIAELNLAADGVLSGDGHVEFVQSVVEGSAGVSLDNVSDCIVLDGKTSDSFEVGLTNGAAGLITSVGPATSTLVSSGTIDNAGHIHGVHAGLIIEGAIDNTGQLKADGSTLTVTGAVSGDGVGRIVNGGTLALDSSFTENVQFAVHGPSGVLQLAQSQNYDGTIYGFSKTGSTKLDLRDIAFVSTDEATFADGVLTVTDGAHTAQIHLAGDFAGTSFVASSDGAGGVLVVDLGATSNQAAALVSAMAGFGSAAASSAPLAAANKSSPAVLAVPGAAI